MSINLSKKRLEAIVEALVFRLAAEIDAEDGMPDHKAYEDALTWALQEIEKRTR